MEGPTLGKTYPVQARLFVGLLFVLSAYFSFSGSYICFDLHKV